MARRNILALWTNGMYEISWTYFCRFLAFTHNLPFISGEWTRINARRFSCYLLFSLLIKSTAYDEDKTRERERERERERGRNNKRQLKRKQKWECKELLMAIQTAKRGAVSSWPVAELRTGHKGSKNDWSLLSVALRLKCFVDNSLS
jgi:hypothetical protein